MVKSIFGVSPTSTSGSLVLELTKQYTKAWNDKGTGAKKDGSMWKPKGRYYFTMVGNEGYGKPSKETVICSSFTGDALKKPKSFKKIWDDKGTGASKDRSIWQPIAPKGYVSLGHVALGHYDCEFSNSKTLTTDNVYVKDFRCVREDLVREVGSAVYENVWNDKSSGASKDGSLWKYNFDEGDIQTYISSSRAREGYSQPAEPAYAFKDECWSIISKDDGKPVTGCIEGKNHNFVYVKFGAEEWKVLKDASGGSMSVGGSVSGSYGTISGAASGKYSRSQYESSYDGRGRDGEKVVLFCNHCGSVKLIK